MEEKGTLTRKELFFFIGVILYYSTFFVELTVLTDTWDLNTPVFKAIRLLSYLLFVLVILHELVLRKTLVLFCIVLPIIGLCALYGDDNSVIYMLLMMMAGLCTTSRKWIAAVMWLQIICLVVVISFSAVGIFEDVLYISEDRVRHCLGFFWTTTPALLAFFCFVCPDLSESRQNILDRAFGHRDSSGCFICADGFQNVFCSGDTAGITGCFS